jgi:uncharacterized Zn finger protein (UPF0148 family)
MKRCPRCGQTFQPAQPGDRYCPPCHRDVVAITAADARRQIQRFPTSKDLSGAAAA